MRTRSVTDTVAAVLFICVAVIPFLVVPTWDRGYELPKLIMVWALGIIAGGIGLRHVLIYGWGKITAIDIGIMVWIVAGMLAVLVSPDPYDSFFGSYERGMGLLTELTGVGIYLGARSYFRKEWYLRVELGAVVVGIFLVGGGFVQQAFHWPTDFVMVGGIDTPRMSGTFGNSLFFGTTLAVLIPFALQVMCRREWWKKIVGIMAVCLMGWGIMQSLSRTAVVAAIAGIVIFGIIHLEAGSRRRRAISMVFTIGVLIVSVGITSSWISKRSSLDASARIRLADWKVAWHEGIRAPLGHGQETFWRAGIARPKFPREPNDGYSDRAHNLLLDELYSGGYLGLAGLTVMIIGGMMAWWRNRHIVPALGPALVALLVALMFLFHFSVSFLLLTLFLGMLAAVDKMEYNKVPLTTIT